MWGQVYIYRSHHFKEGFFSKWCAIIFTLVSEVAIINWICNSLWNGILHRWWTWVHKHPSQWRVITVPHCFSVQTAIQAIPFLLPSAATSTALYIKTFSIHESLVSSFSYGHQRNQGPQHSTGFQGLQQTTGLQTSYQMHHADSPVKTLTDLNRNTVCHCLLPSIDLRMKEVGRYVFPMAFSTPLSTLLWPEVLDNSAMKPAWYPTRKCISVHFDPRTFKLSPAQYFL